MEGFKSFWKFAYVVWPPVTRVCEHLGFHGFRQKFLLGHLNANFNKDDLVEFLSKKGFEFTILAWHDPGEIVSMRKVDKNIYQHHIRLFVDGEIRAHYEYSPESSPWGHFWEAHFVPETEFYRELLNGYLVSEDK